MNLKEIEHIYAELLQADDETPADDHRGKEAIQELKSHYLQILTNLRKEIERVPVLA